MVDPFSRQHFHIRRYVSRELNVIHRAQNISRRRIGDLETRANELGLFVPQIPLVRRRQDTTENRTLRNQVFETRREEYRLRERRASLSEYLLEVTDLCTEHESYTLRAVGLFGGVVDLRNNQYRNITGLLYFLERATYESTRARRQLWHYHIP